MRPCLVLCEIHSDPKDLGGLGTSKANLAGCPLLGFPSWPYTCAHRSMYTHHTRTCTPQLPLSLKKERAAQGSSPPLPKPELCG